ncbi:MAG: hypothetical protein RLZZ623_700 [Actinomycetota bacterium]
MVHDMLPFASSLAIGLLLGFERERSHEAGVRQMAGSRTFALLALCGALAASLDPWVIAAGALAVGALVAVGYRRTSDDDPGATTEVAALVTFLLGALTWSHAGLSASIAITVIVLLATKGRIHSFAREVVSDTDVEDVIKLLVMAFIVLPLLPNRSVGPYGVLNPQKIWQLVLALTGISWAGYVATRVLGPRRGLLITGLAGGFISASATTASMARLSRSANHARVAVAGASLASLATFVQLAGIIAVADARLLGRLWPALLVGAVAMAAVAAFWVRRSIHAGEAAPEGENCAQADETAVATTHPFGLRPALVLAAVLTFAVLVGRWLVDVIGPQATLLASGAAGFADAHAGAIAAATLYHDDQIEARTALLGIGVAVATNTVLKGVLAFAAGGRTFGWRFTPGMVVVIGLFLTTLAFTTAS